MAISQNFPNTRPSLNLNFARSKKLDPRITFTRSSSATYTGGDGLIKSAATNTPRFDFNATTGECLGLLIEESRSNLITYSEQFNDASWVKANASITANNIVAPDGTLTADKLVENTSSSAQHFQSQSITIVANTLYTATIFIKANTRSSIRFGFLNNTLSNGAYAHFNASTGVISSQTTAGTASSVSFSMDSFTSGWYRCRVSCIVDNSSTTGVVFIGIVDNSNNAVYTGDGTSGIYVWGAQTEAGAFPTSYIPTVASTRTRAADNASITGKNFSSWYRQDEGTIYSNINFYDATGNVAGYKILQGSSLRGLGVQYATSSTSFVARTIASGFYAVDGPLKSKKVAGRYKIGYSVGASIDGSGPVTSFSTSEPVFGTESQMDIGGARSLSGGNNKFNGTINRITYYNRYLPLSQLQTLTS